MRTIFANFCKAKSVWKSKDYFLKIVFIFSIKIDEIDH